MNLANDYLALSSMKGCASLSVGLNATQQPLATIPFWLTYLIPLSLATASGDQTEYSEGVGMADSGHSWPLQGQQSHKKYK